MIDAHCNIIFFLLLLVYFSSYLLIELILSIGIIKQHYRRKFYIKTITELEQLERGFSSIDNQKDDITL